jgi:spoIIIJ-associated protein
MLEQSDLNKIKEIAQDFFSKTTFMVSGAEINLSATKEESMVVDLNIKLEEPQILIGQGGQTLLEVQRLLRMLLNKKLGKIFYLNLDINDYKKQKVEYLKEIAKDLADQVALTRQEKILSPMSSYERRIIHSELSSRADIVTESRGEGQERCVVIKPK